MTMTKTRKAKLIFATLFLGLFAVLILQNREDVTARLLFADVTLPLAAWLMATFAIGFLLAWLLGIGRRKRAAAAKKPA